MSDSQPVAWGVFTQSGNLYDHYDNEDEAAAVAKAFDMTVGGLYAEANGVTEMTPKERKAVEEAVRSLGDPVTVGMEKILSGLKSLLKRDRSKMISDAVEARRLAEEASARHRKKAEELGREVDRLNRLRPERRGGLPESWVKEQLAKGAVTVFGVPSESLSHDELRAALVGGAAVLTQKQVVTLHNSRLRTREEARRDAEWIAAQGDRIEVRYE